MNWMKAFAMQFVLAVVTNRWFWVVVCVLVALGLWGYYS